MNQLNKSCGRTWYVLRYAQAARNIKNKTMYEATSGLANRIKYAADTPGRSVIELVENLFAVVGDYRNYSFIKTLALYDDEDAS